MKALTTRQLVSALRRSICAYAPRLCRVAPNALFITCIVTILHVQTTWLRAIEASMFVFISQLTLGSPDTSGRNHRVVVVEIDNLTYEDEYHERTPLDRCALKKQLGAIYAARPQVVAIDLDLSPATWIKSRQQACPAGGSAQCEFDCQVSLYEMIKDRAQTSGIATVMLQPFDGEDRKARDDRLSWRDCMQHGCPPEKGYGAASANGLVGFANGDIPVEYGLTLKFPNRSDSFAGMARSMADGCEAPPRTGQGCNDSEPEREGFIDSRAYLNDIDLILLKDLKKDPAGNFEPKELTDKLMTSLNSLVPQRGEHAVSKVVFFGAGYGEDDRFLTPIGHLYGVEAHAGAYLRHGIQFNEIFEFLADWILATFFGVFGIGNLWERYFHARFSGSPLRGAAAPLFILRLTLQVVAMLAGLIGLATIAFIWLNLWLSPLALAVGMLFDSFVGGAVEGAIHAHSPHRHGFTGTAANPRSALATGVQPQVVLKTAFVREEAHDAGPTVVTAEFTEVTASGVAAVSSRPRVREEPPVSQWLNGTWRMFRWLIYAWAALDVLSSLNGG